MWHLPQASIDSTRKSAPARLMWWGVWQSVHAAPPSLSFALIRWTLFWWRSIARTWQLPQRRWMRCRASGDFASPFLCAVWPVWHVTHVAATRRPCERIALPCTSPRYFSSKYSGNVIVSGFFSKWHAPHVLWTLSGLSRESRSVFFKTSWTPWQSWHFTSELRAVRGLGENRFVFVVTARAGLGLAVGRLGVRERLVLGVAVRASLARVDRAFERARVHEMALPLGGVLDVLAQLLFVGVALEARGVVRHHRGRERGENEQKREGAGHLAYFAWLTCGLWHFEQFSTVL